MRLLRGKRSNKVEPKKAKGAGAFLAGRGIAIAVLAIVSGACFALGFFVGKASTSAQVVTEVISVAADSDTAPVQYTTGMPIAGENGTNQKSDTSNNAEAATSPGTGAIYTVQVGAFADNDQAQDMRNKFSTKGYPAYVLESSSLENKPIYRVRVGRYNNKADAFRMALKLKRHEGATTYVTASN
jgi:cell division septation protein DedD